MTKTYKYLLKEEEHIHTSIRLHTPFTSKWISISENGVVYISRWYAWNGCSPCINVFDLFLINTPNGIKNPYTGLPKTYNASLVHDALVQFSKEHKIPRKIVDRVFYETLKQCGFKAAGLYYMAVKVFSALTGAK